MPPEGACRSPLWIDGPISGVVDEVDGAVGAPLALGCISGPRCMDSQVNHGDPLRIG